MTNPAVTARDDQVNAESRTIAGQVNAFYHSLSLEMERAFHEELTNTFLTGLIGMAEDTDG